MLRRLLARLRPTPPGQIAAPPAGLSPRDPLATAAGLRGRSAPLFAARRERLAAVEAVLAELAAAGELRDDQRDYAELHRLRFAEAAGAIQFGLKAHPDWPACRVADIGSSLTPILYKRLFPSLRFYAACLFRHEQLRGVVEEAAQLDLEKADLREGAVLPFRDLHLVMLCEVLEHLVVSPQNLFRSLAASLAPGGLLYVTTPNFLRHEARLRLAAGRNPQPVFPVEYRPQDRFHFHVREYAMAELLEAMRGAGLTIRAAYYSDCWDGDAAQLLAPDAWKNLVVLGRKK